MRKLIVLFAIVAVVAWSGAGLAQHKNSNGIGYFALQVPDPTKMKIDAYDDDWGWFDPAYVIGSDQMASTVQFPMPEKDDWDASFRVAWTEPGQGGEGFENMWYVFVIVTDDTLDHDITDPDRGFNDDDVEFSTDMDASGGPFPDRIHAQQWTFHLATEGYPYVAQLRYKLPPEMQWGTQPPYCEAAARVEPEGSGHLATNVTLYYEWKIAAWDTYKGAGPDASVRHMMTAGETVPTVVQVNEADGAWQNQIGTCPDNKGGNGSDASVMSLFTLLPIGSYESAVEPGSWGTIKALFR